jgi:hypothetical protein
VLTESLISSLVALATYPNFFREMQGFTQDLVLPLATLAALPNHCLGARIKTNKTKMHPMAPDPLCLEQPLKDAIWELKKRLLEVVSFP